MIEYRSGNREAFVVTLNPLILLLPASDGLLRPFLQFHAVSRETWAVISNHPGKDT